MTEYPFQQTALGITITDVPPEFRTVWIWQARAMYRAGWTVAVAHWLRPTLTRPSDNMVWAYAEDARRALNDGWS